MDAFYPEPEELKQLEKDTLKLLSEGQCFRRHFVEIVRDASRVQKLVRPEVGSVVFNSTFQLQIENKQRAPRERRIDIGALIEVNSANAYTNVSYYFAIGKSDKASKPVLRKLHFDFEPFVLRNISEPKPSMHLQVCGALTPAMVAAGYKPYHLDNQYPWLSKPRIPCLPMSLALMLDWLFLEFRHDRSALLVLEDNQWRNHILNIEHKLLTPFFESCATFTRRKKRDELFYSRFLYDLER